jgi:AraC-like DNA-binding protein
MPEERSEAIFLTSTGFAARQAIRELRARDIAVGPLLRKAGLPESEVERVIHGGHPVKNRISALGQSRFLDLAAEAAADHVFGLRLAERADARDAGILYYVVCGGRDVEQALKSLARYYRLANDAIRLKLTRTAGGGVFEADVHGIPVQTARQNVEFGFAVIIRALRKATGRALAPDRIVFAHSRGAEQKECERFFHCPVEFGRAASEGVSVHRMELSADFLAAPLLTADAKLLDALKPFCDAAALERGAVSGTLRSVAEHEIEKLLPTGKAQAQNVAKALALSVRTLSRRLAEEGTTFAEVVDELRRSLAHQYLKDPAMSLSQISWLLGYEGSTSFNHAYKRWTGRSPSAARGLKAPAA